MKKLFEGIKSDIKFKSAGRGHKLNEERSVNPDIAAKEQPKPRKPPSEEAQIAAASAAMARLESMQGKGKGRAKDTVWTPTKRELEVNQEVNIIPSCKNTSATGKESSSVCKIMFRCPLTGELLQKEGRESHIRKSIDMLSTTDSISASIMKIHTFNKDRDKVRLGVETMAKYFSNIIGNPDEEKYRTIRLSNKVFREKISSLEGAHEFLEAVGFQKKTLPLAGQEVQDEFYVLGSEALKSLDDLQRYQDCLLSGEPIRATLDRQSRVFAPSVQAAKFDLPDDFYNLTAEEIKREQQLRKEKLERGAILRTKAMREREEQREVKKYKYTVLRIRFPDGYLLQGIFYTWEKLSVLFDFVHQQLQNDWLPYELIAPCGQKLENEQVAFSDCGLVPSALLTFRWDAAILADVEAAEGHKAESGLKQELLSHAESLY
ncbi:UBX domain-containing protein 6 [Mixophyes fleayi]|uniref:UBX domain-containing protein 6 n=1 Tax=Mixophyes fleayi TaxID=3061075 RepID=UPI003F4E1FD1